MADTIAPYGAVKIAFDNPVEDSTLMIKLFPDNILITANLNKQKDTAYFSLPFTISGSSAYKLVIESDSGSFWNRKAFPIETLYFHTWPEEAEPNNSAETADSVTGKIYGTLATTDDIDWFIIDPSDSGKCVLKSFGTTVEKSIIMSGDGKTYKKSVQVDTALFTVPDNLMGAAFIVIYTNSKSAGGYYEISIQR